MLKVVSIIVGLLGALLALGATVLLIYFPAIVRNKLQEEMPLKKGSPMTQRWSNIEVPIFLRLYLFDVQNAEDVENNYSRAIVREKGPYVFREKMRKDIIRYSDNGSLITYRTIRTFFFEPTMSTGTLEDEITHVNVPLVAALSKGKQDVQTEPLGDLMFEVLNSVVREMELSLFESHTVGQILFEGYKVPLAEKLTSVAKEFGIDVPENEGLPNNTFGLFYGKNNSDDGLWTVDTGLYDISNYLKVHSWNSKTQVDHWAGPECNMINGTDGASFPPGISRKKPLFAFAPDLCRSLPLEYEKDVTFEGIQAYRFTTTDKTFMSPKKNPANQCFCVQPDKKGVCDVDGVLDLSACRKGAPVAASAPHFYQGDPSLLINVIGVDPYKEKHASFLDIEPTTGVPMRAMRRLQINIRIENDPEIPTLEETRSMVLPLLWLQESAQLPENLINDFKTKLGAIKTGSVAIISMVVIGIIVVIIGIGLNIYWQKTMKQKSIPSTDRSKNEKGLIYTSVAPVDQPDEEKPLA